MVACGLEEPDHVEQLFPQVRYVRVARAQALPFADREFDLAFCNAVIEHVGTRERQRAFLADVLRVARMAFVTTPNRWYPVELHTLLPLLHYMPHSVYRRIYHALGFEFFSREENLNLLGRRELEQLVPIERRGSVRILSHRFLGLVSNYFLVARS